MDFEIGQRVADYEIVNLIGVGGMGRVYRVRNTISHRTEAMKVLLADLSADPELAARFLSEIRTLAALDHPHIAQLHTAMQTGNELIMMMEFVDGSTLQQLARQAPFPPEKIVHYMHQVLAALSFAHSRGVIHRDIKPANIMVTPTGMIKLTDFGIAKSKLEDELTRPGTTVGSLNYMSPEQALGGCLIDGRADLYSLGITMYELLAGRRPFEDESAYVVLHRQLNTEPRPPVEVNPLLSQPLSDLIMKALEKDPLKRFQDAAAFSLALREATGIAASTPVRSYPAFASRINIVPAAAPAVAARFSTAAHRRLRFAAEACAVVAALVFAAISVPHFLAAGAPVRSLVKFTEPPASISSADSDQASFSNIGQAAATTPELPPSIQSSSEEPTPAATAVQSEGHKTAIAASSSLLGRSSPRGYSAESGRARANFKAASLRSEPSPAQKEGPSGTPATIAPVAVAPPAELQKLRDQMMLLDARAGSLRLSVQRLKSQREAAGDGLNQDVANAYVRMNAYLSAEKVDLEDGDAAAARDHLEKANAEENALDKLFKANLD